MPALDTNVLVRYLVADDPEQHRIAKAFIEERSHEDRLFVPLSVTVELEWVLRSLYAQEKESMLSLFSQLLESRELSFMEEASVEVALNLYADSNTDFADCLHVACAYVQGKGPMITFDKKASRLENAALLK